MWLFVIWLSTLLAQDILTSSLPGGTTYGISEELISLKICSTDVPDLTLIDLPGLVRCATKDQPPDVHMKIRDMVHKYAGCEETVILCVIPLNQDSATVEAYQIAQEVDPEVNHNATFSCIFSDACILYYYL